MVIQKTQFLQRFVIVYEFKIEDSIRIMQIKYCISSVTHPSLSFLLIILDLNVRFQRLNQALRKIRNGESKNLLETKKIRDGVINVVKYKNTILYLIDVIYDGNLPGNSVSLVKKEELKAALQNDFFTANFFILHWI